MKYYTINEATARTANNINSFSEYTANSATNGYKSEIDEVYAIAEQIKAKHPHYAEKVEYMADRYAKKYADYLNAYYRNEASCPSVLICGAGNFPVGKKNKQNSRRESLNQEYNKLKAYRNKIESYLYSNRPILSSEEDALERLQDKLSDLETEQEFMKAVNAYYRKNKTCIGCELMDEKDAEAIDEVLKSGRVWYDVPFASFKLSNNNANIRSTKERIAKLQSIKEQGTTETENDLFKVIENTEIMRLQLVFDGKPEESIRNILKSHGFKWSPSNSAWQRQLTDNAKYALKQIKAELSI